MAGKDPQSVSVRAVQKDLRDMEKAWVRSVNANVKLVLRIEALEKQVISLGGKPTKETKEEDECGTG